MHRALAQVEALSARAKSAREHAEVEMAHAIAAVTAAAAQAATAAAAAAAACAPQARAMTPLGLLPSSQPLLPALEHGARPDLSLQQLSQQPSAVRPGGRTP